MQFHYSPFSVPLAITAAISIWLMIYTWTRRKTHGAVYLSALALAITIWQVSYALEIAGSDLATKLFWGQIAYLAIAMVPVLWFGFAYVRWNKIIFMGPQVFIPLVIVPLITFALAMTTTRHGLIWKSFQIFENGSFSALQVTYGLWFWVHSVYSYILLVLGTYYLLRTIIKKKGVYRGQTTALLVAVVSPWAGNFLYISRISPFPFLDLTPFAFAITLVSLTMGIFGFQLINLAPLARDFLIEKMEDGVIVVGVDDRVTDVNPSVLKILNKPSVKVLGCMASEVFSNLPQVLEKYNSRTEDLGEMQMDDDPELWYEVNLSVVRDRNQNELGYIIIFHNISKRKQIEIRLSQLNRAIEASPSSIVITDVHGKIEYVNPKFTRVTGYSSSEVIGQSPSILKTSITPRKTHAELWSTISAGKEWHGEFCNRKKSGEFYWEMASISPIRDSLGKTTHFVAVKEDITEQRLLQDQLRQQNDYLSVLHQITLDLLNRRSQDDLLQAIVDQASTLLRAPYVEILLKEGEHLIVRSSTGGHAKLVGEKIARSMNELAWQAYDTGRPVILGLKQPFHFENSGLRESTLHSTAYFPVMAAEECIAVLAAGRASTTDVFFDEEIRTGQLFGQLAALVLDNANLYNSAVEELAERRRSERLLAESENRYRQLIENASDLIYRVNTEGQFIYVNPPTLHMLGYPYEQALLGKHFSMLVAPESRNQIADFYRQQIVERKVNSYVEFPAWTADGSVVWLGQNVQLVKENGKVVGLQAVARDITERKRTEEALELARDQAQEANQFKSQLLAKVSHELRTPLGAIMGFSELMKTGTFGPLNQKQIEVSGQIITSVEFLNEMVNELLDEAQISAKKMVLKLEQFSLSDLLHRLETNMVILVNRKQLAFSLSIDPRLPDMLYGDEARVQQILVNLVGNAIKFTRSGGVSLEAGLQDAQHWMLKITDSGVGVPKEALQYIFEPFRQVESSISYDNRGSGLGLTITKQLVELMDGKITVQSVVGQGSTFTVILPLVESLERPRGKTNRFDR